MTTYSETFYNRIREGCQRSAEAVVPVVLDRVGHLSSVVDVGCGEGWWGDAFASAGVWRVLGLDGEYVKDSPEGATIQREGVDLSQHFELDEHFDLAVCLEVAEHLSESRAAGFVADLCALSDVVLFSAAMPRQDGTGHVNCQPPAYWAALFANEGYSCDGSLRWDVWNNPDVEPWYSSNMLLFRRIAGVARTEVPLHVIHPDLWLTPR